MEEEAPAESEMEPHPAARMDLDVAAPGATAETSLGESTSAALQSIGLTRDQALVMTSLADASRSLPDLGRELGWPERRSRQTLEALTRMGVVKRLPGRPLRFALSSPEATLTALVQRKESEIEDARRLIDGLIQRAKGVGAESYMEVVIGADALSNRFAQIMDSARREILACMKAPFLVATPETGNPAGDRAIKRGVQTRGLWEQSLLDTAGMLEFIKSWADRGEIVRVHPSVPSKLFIVDRAIAWLHVAEPAPEGPVTLGIVTRHPEIVTTLHRLFELLWAQSIPLFPDGEAEANEEAAAANGQQPDPLLSCLLAGMKDEAIGRQLGLSRRTVARRVQQLLQELQADTRFQAGFQLGRRWHDREG